jgi:hypothetical protein
MPARATAAATARRHAAPAPRIPRRVSGPAVRPVTMPDRRPLSGATVALPSARPLRRLRAVPDHRLLDTLLRSRAWIWLLGIGLGGIVFMQVSLLKMNSGISRAVETAATLERSNAQLEGQVAELSSGERIRTLASGLGLISPDAGSVGYLRVRPGVDGRRAARNMTTPSDQARQLLASGGRPTATAPIAPIVPIVPAATTTAPAPAATTTPAPAATATPAPAATATPAPAAAPVSAPTGGTTGTTGATGAAAAPSGQG